MAFSNKEKYIGLYEISLVCVLIYLLTIDVLYYSLQFQAFGGSVFQFQAVQVRLTILKKSKHYY